jgi:hypothetical protein
MDHTLFPLDKTQFTFLSILETKLREPHGDTTHWLP